MASKERIKKLVDAAMPLAVTLKFLRFFYQFGKKEGFFPAIPPGLEDEELGEWMRKSKIIPDEELLKETMMFIEHYGAEKLIEQRSEKIRMPAKTLANFLQMQHGDCIAESTALGEMAIKMGFKVQYCFV